MKGILPYSSCKQIIDFKNSSANEPVSIWNVFMKQLWEYCMNFNSMISKLNDNVKAFRPPWGEGSFLWKKDEVLVHNVPYWGGELVNQYLEGYPYVVDIRDIKADDWMLTTNED